MIDVIDFLVAASPAPVTRPGDLFRLLYSPQEKISVITNARFDLKAGKQVPSGWGMIFEAGPLADAVDAGRIRGAGGVWFRPAPVTWDRAGFAQRGVTDSDCTPRYLLLELEVATIDAAKRLLDLRLPIVAGYTSGASSVHFLMRLDVCPADWKPAAQIILRSLAPLGIDPRNCNASRLSRLPGAMRPGHALQKLCYLAPSAE